MWFKALTGIEEGNRDFIHSNIKIEGEDLIVNESNKRLKFGRLEIIDLGELKQKSKQLEDKQGKPNFIEVVGDVQLFHLFEDNQGAMFQAASQFNLLEMMSPDEIPEDGLTKYEYDKTQGPACAIACGAGTIYRNYFIPLENQIGQTYDSQIDCLSQLGELLGNENERLWRMVNGYLLIEDDQLKEVDNLLSQMSTDEFEIIKENLKVGIQWDTEVTISTNKQTVSQIYCSALPIAYNDVTNPILWQRFAKLILEATYEATFHAAIINASRTGNNKLYLTLVGGGAFGNNIEWIIDAIESTFNKFSSSLLDVKLISYGSSNKYVKELVDKLNLKH